jgi:hypothetical protein
MSHKKHYVNFQLLAKGALNFLSSGNSVSFSAAELNTIEDSVTLTAEQTEQIRTGRNTVYLIPELGSELMRFGNQTHFVFARAVDQIIDFNDSDNFSGDVLFAETAGDNEGIKYHYTPVIHVKAQPGYGIVV